MTDKTDQRLRLTLRQLEVFIATAREGSTRAAADKVARSQSATSTALVELEAVLGVALFDRTARRLKLNEHGRALLPRAVALTEQAQELEALHGTASPLPLRIAASYTIGEYLLPPLISVWKQTHPAVQVYLDIANSSAVIEATANFEVDIGFIEGARTHPDLDVRHWLSDELVVFAAPGDPLVGRRVRNRTLADASWILREQGSGTRETSDAWLNAHLPNVTLGLELGSNEAVKRAVASGLGVGCLSRHAVQDAVQHGWLVELKTSLPPIKRTLALVTHRRRTLAGVTNSFVLHCLQSRFASQAPAHP